MPVRWLSSNKLFLWFLIGWEFKGRQKNYNTFSVKGSPIMPAGNNAKDINKAIEENEAHNLYSSDHQNAYVSYPYVESSER